MKKMRSLRTRLVALYVFVAIVLVAVVGTAITAFALSSYAFFTQQTVETVAREVPDVTPFLVTQTGSLDEAAPEIIRHLAQPSVRIAVFAVERGIERPIAISEPNEPTDRVMVVGVQPANGVFVTGSGPFGQEGSPGQQPQIGTPPPPLFDYRVLRISTPADGTRLQAPRPDFPFKLNLLLGMHPERVPIAGGAVVIFPDPHPLETTISAFWKAMLPLGALAVLIAFLLGRYITNQALRPLVETTNALRSFAAGDFTPRPVATSQLNEIGELVRAYNGAAAQVAAAFDERRAAEERMRQFIADAGHELRTPLTVLMGFIDVMQRRLPHVTRMREALAIMEMESRRMRSLIDKLIRLARLERVEGAEHPSTTQVSLAQTVARVVAAAVGLGGDGRISVDVPGEIIVKANEGELYDAMANLMENALKYAPHSPVTVRAFVENGSAVIEIEDRGPGLSLDDQQHIFERFYRGENRSDREGFGLGLAIVKRTVERAGGEVGVVSAPGEGARFWIRLPLAVASGSSLSERSSRAGTPESIAAAP